MLSPNDHEQEVTVDITVIDRLLDSPTPSFGRAAQEFRTAFQPGDLVVEYFTSRGSWDALFGRAGYRIMRSERVVSDLITRLN